MGYDCTISFSLWRTMVKMVIYTQECDQEWLKINNRDSRHKDVLGGKKSKKLSIREGGTIIRDSRVHNKFVTGAPWKYDFFSDGKISVNMKRWWIIGLWMFSSIKLFIYTEINGTYFSQKSKFYYARSKYIMKDWDFIMTGRDILRKVKISLWSVKIFYGRSKSYHGRSRFYYELSRFLFWQVEIFMMEGPGFHDDKSRFSW